MWMEPVGRVRLSVVKTLVVTRAPTVIMTEDNRFALNQRPQRRQPLQAQRQQRIQMPRPLQRRQQPQLLVNAPLIKSRVLRTFVVSRVVNVMQRLTAIPWFKPFAVTANKGARA